MKLYHQAGHNTVWNLNSIADGVGEGIIFSPVHYPPSRLEAVDADTKAVSLFDPQFYVPDSQKSKLNEYSFFPEVVAGGFGTEDFEALAGESARLCVDFQVAQGFERIIVPARYHEDMVTDYIARQRAFTVEPFLDYISAQGLGNSVMLTLPLTASMIVDAGYRTNLLNWITAYPKIAGVYTLVNFGESTKQIQDFNKLNAYLEFIQELQNAGLDVLCGYCNTEGLLLSVLRPFGVTMGAYENTRMFSIDKFLDDDSVVQGPAPRIYLPKLLNWIRFDTADEIRGDHPSLWSRIYTPTDYSEEVFTAFDAGTRPHFTQPKLYQHHFKLISEQYQAVGGDVGVLQSMVTQAHTLYEEIAADGVMFFDSNCRGEHLPVWNRCINRLRS